MQIRYDMVNGYIVRADARGDGHEFLQIRRRADDFMGGTWQTVYGQSEPGETPPQAIVRELREETGLKPRELYRLERVMVFYIAPQDTMWHSVQFCAIVDRAAAVTLNDEHDQARWVAASDAERHFMWRQDRQSIREIREEILGNGLAKPYVRLDLP